MAPPPDLDLHVKVAKLEERLEHHALRSDERHAEVMLALGELRGERSKDAPFRSRGATPTFTLQAKGAVKEWLPLIAFILSALGVGAGVGGWTMTQAEKASEQSSDAP